MSHLVASDLDGTLLRSDGTVSPRTAGALEAVRAEGIEVVLATGRPIRYVEQLARELTVTAPVVCANGAVLYDAAADAVVGAQLLDVDVARELAETVRKRYPDMLFAAETARGFACQPAFAAASDWPLPEGAVRTDGGWLDGEAPAKLLLRHPDRTCAEIIEELSAVVGDVATVTHSSATLLEIAAVGVTKAAGLARLVSQRGLTAADVVAFGDMPNDVAMLAWAGRSVAMANAHPDVLAVADEVTASNDDDGVAVRLEALLG